MSLLSTQSLFTYSLAPVIVMLLKLLSKGHHDVPNPIAFFTVFNFLFPHNGMLLSVILSILNVQIFFQK